MLPPQQGRDDSLRARLAQGREANLPKPIEVWGTGEAWTGRPCEGPRVQTCPAYRHRATSLLYPRTSPRARTAASRRSRRSRTGGAGGAYRTRWHRARRPCDWDARERRDPPKPDSPRAMAASPPRMVRPFTRAREPAGSPTLLC